MIPLFAPEGTPTPGQQRWLQLLHISASNARLATRHSEPDFGYYDIHKAIFGLLETAPIKHHWCDALYGFLTRLDFQHVHHPERIDHVLARWARLPTLDEKDSLREGNIVGLSRKDELRCLIATLYGGEGQRDAADIALRCAYYAKGYLTVKDMEAGYEKDGDVFTFAANLNTQTHWNRDLRRLMEEKYLNRTITGEDYFDGEITRGWLRGRWRWYDEQLQKKWPNLIPPVSQELATEPTSKALDTVRSSIVELQKELQKGLTTLLRALVIAGAIILAILIYLRSK